MVGMRLLRFVRTRQAVLLASILVLGCPALAAGQSGDAPRFSIGVGGGVANPFHGDLQFKAPWWEVAGRGHMSEHMLVEVVFGQWRHTEELVLFNVPLQGPSGLIGRADRLQQQTRLTMNAFEFNVLAGGRIGRARISGGGGAGVLAMRDVFSQRLEGCSEPVPAICQGSNERSRTSTSFAFQGVGGVDIDITRLVAAYGIVRLAIPTRDVGSTELRVAAGVRLVFG